MKIETAEKTKSLGQKFETDKTIFKLTCYYSHKPNGDPWNYTDISQERNRKFHDSHDFILTPNGYITRHDLALNKLLNHIKKHEANIISCLLFYNNHYEKKQYLIGKFYKDETKSQFVQPLFKSYDNGSVFFSELIGKPLGEFDLIHRFLTKKVRKLR